MKLFLITVLISFVTILGVAILITFCKKRPRNGKHQLTGMCHRSGGKVCCSGSELAGQATNQEKKVPLS